MSADEESTPAPTDTKDLAMAETQSNKRKASPANDAQSERALSPKRVKLNGPGADTNRKEDGADSATRQENDAADIEVEQPQERKDSFTERERRDRSSPPTSRSSPKPSRSPTLARRPSIPASDSKQVPGPGPERGRRSISEQEKKRGQRLFGGLLSTLSQKPAGQQQKRRAEIERRQQERAQQQRAEDDKRRAEKLAKLNRVREIEQVKFDEDVMRTRHQSMLAQARNLSTKSEPKLFYIPWTLTEEQKILRKEQIIETTRIVAREAEQFKRQKQERLRKLGVTADEPDSRKEDTNGGPGESGGGSTAPVEDTGDKLSPSKAVLGIVDERAGHDNHHDDAGDVMVENDEDTVIY